MRIAIAACLLAALAVVHADEAAHAVPQGVQQQAQAPFQPRPQGAFQPQGVQPPALHQGQPQPQAFHGQQQQQPQQFAGQRQPHQLQQPFTGQPQQVPLPYATRRQESGFERARTVMMNFMESIVNAGQRFRRMASARISNMFANKRRRSFQQRRVDAAPYQPQ